MAKDVRVYESLGNAHVVDGRDSKPGCCGCGPAADCHVIYRSRNRATVEAWARGRQCYSGLATVRAEDVPRRIAARWGLAA